MTYVKRELNRNQTQLRESIIDTISRELFEEGLEPETVESRRWLMQRAREIFNINRREMVNEDSERRVRNAWSILPGRMFLFLYFAKHDKTLKYWDRFPLVMPIATYGKQGFLGINFHYLPPQHRFFLIDRLKVFLNNKSYDETTRVRLSYRLIQRYARLKAVKPCIHMYLYSHIRSRMLRIPIDEWDVTLSLPCEAFKGANKIKVWRDSMKALRKRQARKNKIVQPGRQQSTLSQAKDIVTTSVQTAILNRIS